MLHDPGSYAPPLIIDEIDLEADEKENLRSLARRIAEIAADPVNAERAELWRRLNDLEQVRPMVWINEIPWHEMNVGDELTLRCRNAWARTLETELRRVVYQWRHMPGDMVVNPWIECPLAIHSTDFGIVEEVDLARTDAESDIVSRRFHVQIKEPEDLEKIRMPEVTHIERTTAAAYDTMCDLFGGIIPVRKVGQTHIWYAPWDYLIRWWGVQEAILDMIDRPDMVHAGYERMVDAWMTELDQFEEQNLLSLDCRNIRVGSGGYGYASDLPGKGYDPERVAPRDMWGCSNAQILTTVSAEMQWEFAIEHDLKWMRRWGLNYYGCCEPLDRKVELLDRIPNLRKVSVSPWNDYRTIFDGIGPKYVASVKPNPAIFLDAEWSEEAARAAIAEALDLAGERGVAVELIMKDISTVQHRPRRLWAWAGLAAEELRRRGD
ncbi:MAG TPA: hypothetical protein VMV90_05410 [Rectinemataceae bacterium]|nr:hypothetical protein [Rectinemataceae bacterium]